LSDGVFARPVPHPLDEVRGLLFSVSGSGGLQVRERLRSLGRWACPVQGGAAASPPAS
jgi:hypothetical protein